MTWTTEIRLQWALRLTAFGMLSGVLLSWNLWHTTRLYPLFPVADWVPQFPQPFDLFFLCGFLATLVALVVRPNQVLIAVVVAISIILALQDQSRWQPWFYQYLLMLVVFGFVGPANSENTGLFMLQFIVAWVYIWSGIHKCQPKWFLVWEGYLISPITDQLKDGFVLASLYWIGKLIPIVEILMGIGLFFSRTRVLAIGTILLSHVSILILLGPVQGYISNSVVWPWNLIMMALVTALFYKTDSIKWFPLFKGPLLIPRCALVFFMCIAPALYYAGWWDRYLSFSLYAGQQRQYFVLVPNKALSSFPKEWEPYYSSTKSPNTPRFLSPGKWSYQELNVPLISEWRILKSFSKKLCKLDTGNHGLQFYVEYRYLPEEPMRYYRCDQIEHMGSD